MSTSRHERDLNSQLYWWLALIACVVINPNYHKIMTTTGPYLIPVTLSTSIRSQTKQFHLLCAKITKWGARKINIIILKWLLWTFCFGRQRKALRWDVEDIKEYSKSRGNSLALVKILGELTNFYNIWKILGLKHRLHFVSSFVKLTVNMCQSLRMLLFLFISLDETAYHS